MAARIFPNNTKLNMGSKIEFQGINWDEVQSSMKSNRFAEDKTQAVLDLLAQSGINLSPDQEHEISDIVDQFGGGEGGMDNEDHGHSHEDSSDLSPDFQRKPDFESDDHEEDHEPSGLNLGDSDNKSDSNFMKMTISKDNKNMRKIAFTDRSQISAEAIEKALASGDKRLANTILAARKEDRFKLASIIQQKAQKQIKQAQMGGGGDLGALATPGAGGTDGPIASPDGGVGAGADASGGAYQDGFNAGQAASGGMPADNKGYTGTDLFKYMEGFFAAQAQKGEGDMSGAAGAPAAPTDMVGGADSTAGDLNPTTASSVSPNKFSQAQRESFKKISLDRGFPKEYVDAMCGTTPKSLSKDVDTLNNKIKEVYSSSISANTKNSLIKSLIKEAKLAPDSKTEFLKFWNEILGYQDKAFWPQVAEDYTDKN